jgi:pilus assembly protein CpaC
MSIKFTPTLKSRQRFLPLLLSMVLSLLLFPLWLPSVQAENGSGVVLQEGDSDVFRLGADVHRVMVVNADVATAVVLNEREILLTAIRPGETDLMLWYRHAPNQVERRTISVRPDHALLQEVEQLVGDMLAELDREGRVTFEVKPVFLSPNSLVRRQVDIIGNVRDEGVAERTESARQDVSVLQDVSSDTQRNIEGLAGNYLVVLSGKTANDARKRRIQSVMSALGFSVVNMIDVDGPNQIKLSVRVAEVVRGNGFESSPGFDYTRSAGGNSTVNFLLNAAGIASGGATGGAASALSNFTIGLEANNGNLTATLSILESHNLARILANPELLVQAGETADFLVGGEVSFQSIDGQGNPSIEFKEFGVSLKFSPIITEDGRIQMTVNPEVSNPVEGRAGIEFRTRRVNTTITLAENQSFIIGGLLQEDYSSILSQVPLLGDIPVLGVLFRSTRFINQQTELVIMVTPTFEEPITADRQLILPGENITAPNILDALFLGKTHRLLPPGSDSDWMSNLRIGLERPE